MKNLKIDNEFIEKIIIYGGGTALWVMLAFGVQDMKNNESNTDSSEVAIVKDITENLLQDIKITAPKVPIESIDLEAEPPQIEVKKLEKKKTVEEEVEELLKEDPEYIELAKYVSEITEADVDAYVKEILDYYGVTAKSNTFRFNPNNLQEAERRIKAYAEKIDTEENAIYTTEFYIYSTEDDYLVSSYKSEYQEKHPNVSEEELEEMVKEFKEKAAAIYYTKMNLRYLSDESLRSLNKKYHFVNDSENLIEDIKNYMNEIKIYYKNFPLMREMVANEGDYIAHGLLNGDDTVWNAFKIIDGPVVNGVIQGVYGSGEERKENFGYRYAIVQEAVNQKLGVGIKRESVFYRIENGKAMSNLPVLPTNQEELYKYLLIELKYQSQHYGYGNGIYGPESYDPREVLINYVIFGHEGQIYDMLYRTEEITDDVERAILQELNNQDGDAIVFFETVDKVQEVIGNSQKIK